MSIIKYGKTKQFKDIISEESDTMRDSMLEWSDVGKQASQRARNIYFDILNKV